MEIFLIIVAVALVATYAYVKVRERQEARDDLMGEDRPVTTEDLEDLEEIDLGGSDVLEDDDATAIDLDLDTDTDIDLEVDVEADEERSPSSWLSDIAETDDDALSDLVAEPEAEVDDAELDASSVDEEFESLTADLDVEAVEVNEEVESADDIMANSKATEINPAGNSELQSLLQKVQARLAEYE